MEGVLHFNVDTSSTWPCDGEFFKACLCTFTGPFCAHTDGATANAGPCVCGASLSHCVYSI